MFLSRSKTLILIAAYAYTFCAAAQNSYNPPNDCTAPDEVQGSPLLGDWDASINGIAHSATLHLGPHPQWAGTVKGTVERQGVPHAMVGDVDQGHVTLEESANGTNISATWVGTMTEGSCFREIHGQYQEDGEHASALPFVLRKRTP